MPTIPYVPNATWADGSGGGTPDTAAKKNIIEDGIKNLSYAPFVSAYHNANQSITNNTLTALALNSERWDQAANVSDTMHDNVTNNSRLTCRYAGVYQIDGTVEFAANATGARDARIRLNGATYIGFQREPTNTASYSTIVNVTRKYVLAVNDYVELVVLQDSGAGLNVVASSNWSPEFSMVRVG